MEQQLFKNMLIIYGLGNNEEKYLKTKHNIGRVVVENLAKELNLNFNKKVGIFYAKTKLNGEDLWLVYSTGYMNTSGQNLYTFLRYYNLPKYTLLVAHDDSDQIECMNKLSMGGGHAGHNGLKDIYSHFEKLKDRIWRLKIGIRPENNRQKSIDFVLKNLTQKDDENIGILQAILASNIDKINSEKLNLLQQKVNAKPQNKVDTKE